MSAGDATRAPPAAEAQSLVESFCAVTSATPDEAAFFLESHNWALESAVRSFYDSTEADADADAEGPDPEPQPPLLAADDGADSEDEDYVGGGDEDENDEDYVGGGDEDEEAAIAASAPTADERRRPAKRQKSSHRARGGSGGASGRGNVRTFSDLGGGKRGAGSEDEEDSEDEEWAPPPELYTGGEKSGMVVRDRSKRKNVVDEVFKQAKRKGAKQGPVRRQSSSSRSFSGTGRLLTGETVQADTPQPPEEIVHDIYFWSNGFTVDDGPLRSFDDPEHAAFLASIKNSECPTELAPADGRSKVKVNLVRKEEKCPEPVKRAAPFQGGGTTLGTPSDNSAPSDITSVAATSSTVTATETKTITVDDSLPSTSLQIRFADGSRVVARFNTSHTIDDLRAFIDAARPGEASDYTLQVGFPPKPLDDVAKTIEEAGVANSVIIQKI